MQDEAGLLTEATSSTPKIKILKKKLHFDFSGPEAVVDDSEIDNIDSEVASQEGWSDQNSGAWENE